VKITSEEKIALVEWQRNNFNSEDVASVKALFGPNYKRITLCLWAMWWTLNFMFYGMVFILPFILSVLDSAKDHKGIGGLAGLIITISGELPSVALALVIIDDPRFGRRKSLIMAFSSAAVMFVGAYMISTEYFVEMLMVARFCVKMGFAMIYPLTAEVYPTSYRTAGVGFASGVGRIGAAMMPFFCIKAFEYGTLGPILLFAFVSVLAAISSFLIPFDTFGRALDAGEERKTSLLNKDNVGSGYFEMTAKK